MTIEPLGIVDSLHVMAIVFGGGGGGGGGEGGGDGH